MQLEIPHLGRSHEIRPTRSDRVGLESLSTLKLMMRSTILNSSLTVSQAGVPAARVYLSTPSSSSFDPNDVLQEPPVSIIHVHHYVGSIVCHRDC